MKKNSRTKNSILNLFSGLFGQLLITGLRFVVRTVFIQTLGRSYLGINGYFSDILSMLSLTELGFDTAINYKLYKPLAERDDKRVRVLLKFYKLAYRAIGSVILLLGLILIPFLPVLIKDYDRLASLGINIPLVFVLFLLQSVCSYLFFAYRSVVMRADQKKYILDIADYALTILTNTVQIIVLMVLKDFLIYTGVVIVFNILKNLLNAYISQRYYPQFFTKEEDSLSKDEITDLFKDCGALFVYRVNNVVLKATDNTVLGIFIGMSAVGQYSNYLLLYTTIRSFLSRLYTAVKASTGNLFVTESIQIRYRFFKTMNFITMVLYGTACVGIAVCADELIETWIGQDYLIPQPAAIMIGIEILFNGMRQNLGQVRNVTGAFRQAWARPILSIIINIGVSVALVVPLGIYGVLLGTITAHLLTNFLVDPFVIHKYSFSNYKPVSEYYIRNLTYMAELALIGAAEMWICGHFLTGYGWLSVFAHVVIVGISVPAMYAVLYWRSEECQYLRSIAVRVLKKVFNR